MIAALPGPSPDAPARMSPTLLAAYTRCPARAGFERDPTTSWLHRTSPRAALGQVAHRVVELSSAGGEFQSVWDDAAERVFADLAHEWSPAVPPRPSSWPGWAMTMRESRAPG